VLGVFQGLGLTYTRAGIHLDQLTHTQRRVLELLDITPTMARTESARPSTFVVRKMRLASKQTAQGKFRDPATPAPAGPS
jgi:hypothetical protein